MSAEEMIVSKCSPTLLGIKCANLVSLKNVSKAECLALLTHFNSFLNGEGVYILPLKFSDDHILVFVYNRFLLKSRLEEIPVRRFLRSQGYFEFATLKEILCELANRFSTSKNFPHEIGIFLGYPLEDVEGFIFNKGQNYKIAGLWKVYGDEERAKKLFAAYKECSRRCGELYSKGIPLEQIYANSY